MSVWVWRLPCKSFFSYSEGNERAQKWNSSAGLCVSKCLCLLTLGRVIFPISLSWHQLVYRNIQQISAGDSSLLTGQRKNNNHQLCIFPGQWLYCQTPVLAVFLYQSGETQGRTGHPETQKGLHCSGSSLRGPKENTDRAICHYLPQQLCLLKWMRVTPGLTAALWGQGRLYHVHCLR